MITGNIRSQIDALWNAFWTGGIANPLEVIEQITYLLFLKRLDDLHTLEENKSARLKKPMERRVFPEGNDPRGRPYEDCRWSRFKHFDAREMFAVVNDHVFPFLRTLGGDDSTYAHHMKDARFTIPTPALLAKVVDMIDQVPMEDRDTKGDLYEYMLGKIATAGQNGQFRTPRHIIRLMVELTAPTAKDVICDPACGTAGFLVSAGEYLRERHPEILRAAELKEHFHHHMFHGFDFDNTMLRIGSMNMLLHGVENPDIRYRDSLAQDHAGEEEKYTLVLANPPFAGSLDYETCAKDLQQIVKTKKTELLFLALFIRLLKPGGRAAVIVPDGVLFGSSNAHKTLRQLLVEEQKLDAVISLPGGVFRPYAGVSTAILIFTKTNSGGTDHVWFYDVEADGMSLDDKRNELLPPEKLGPVPKVALTAEEHTKNNLPDILARWQQRDKGECKNALTAQSFCVSKADIALQGYDLSLNRYKEVIHKEIAQPPAKRNSESSRPIRSTDPARYEGSGGDAKMTIERVPLGTYVKVVGGFAFKSNDFSNDGIPLIRISDLQNGTLSLKKVARIPKSRVGKGDSYRVEPGDVLIAMSGATTGKIGLVPSDFDGLLLQNQRVGNFKITDKSKIDKGYLKHFVISPSYQGQISNTMVGVAQPNISPTQLESFEFPLPPLAEQRRIAELLDRAEALRAKRRAALAELDSLTQSLFLNLFGDTRKERTRWPTALLENIVRETKLGLVRGSNEFGPEFPFSYVRMNAITRNGELELSGVQRTHATEAEIEAYRLEPGDFLFNTRNSEELVGKTALFRAGGLYLFNNNVMRIRFTSEADPEFIAAAFKTSFVQHELNLRKSGTTNVFAIYYKDLRTLPLPLPLIKLQREFARRVGAVEKLKTVQRKSLAELDALFATLQNRAFKGEL